MRPYVAPSSSAAEPATAPDSARFSPRVPLDTVPVLADADSELDDTLPSGTLPPFEDEAFYEAPTLPGAQLANFGRPELPRVVTSVRDGQWDRVLSVVADTVRRVFASHSA